MADLEIIAIHDIGEVRPGDDLAELIAAADDAHLQDGDCLVITQKVVSKAEGRLVDIDPTDPLSHKPLVEAESVRILRRRGELIISQTEHGFVCANAGIDLSNVERGQAALLPVDSDRSARGIRDRLRARHGHDVAVIISDTFGRPWRRGVTDVAIGCAGIRAVADLRGTTGTRARAHGHRGRRRRRDRRRRRPRDGQSQRCRRCDRSWPRSRVVRARFGRRRNRSRPRRRSFPLVQSRNPSGLLRCQFQWSRIIVARSRVASQPSTSLA